MADSRPELASVILTVRPRQRAVLPLGLGRAAQALLLNRVQEESMILRLPCDIAYTQI